MAKGKSTRTTKRKPASRKPTDDAYQLAMLRFFLSMDRLVSASGVLEALGADEVGEEIRKHADPDSVAEMCRGVIHEESSRLYSVFGEIEEVVGIEFNLSIARRLSEESKAAGVQHAA